MESTVNELCKNIFGIYPDHIEKCSVGSVNIVYMADVCSERYVIRLNRDKGAYSESIDLLKQAWSLGLPVSKVVNIGVYEEFEFIILTYVRGRDLGIVYPMLNTADKMNIAAEVVCLQQKAAGFVYKGNRYPWYKFVYDALDVAEKRIRQNGFFDVSKVEKVRQASQYFTGYFETLNPVTYLDDISTKNLLIENGHVSGIVDIDEIGFGDRLTYVALMRVALRNMGYDDIIADQILNFMNVGDVERRAELFYALLYCVDFMGERGSVFNGKKVPVDEKIISRLNNIYDILWNTFCGV